MKKIKLWWMSLWFEQHELIISVPEDVTYHEDGSKTETTRQDRYLVSKLIKTTPKIFIFIDIDGQIHEIRFVKPVVFHIIKVW
tara:strand:- start:241 stop:489 length:249 start_codon:yes stop_codon:yes gene_type:complete